MSINIQNLISVVNAKLSALDSNSSIEEIFKLQNLRDDLNSSSGVLEYGSLNALPEFDSSSIGKLVFVKDTNESPGQDSDLYSLFEESIQKTDKYGAFYFGTSSGWQGLEGSLEFNPPISGGHLFTTSTYDAQQTYSWTCPAGVTSVCVLCIGGGGAGQIYTSYNSGGGGGGLGWKNDIPVVPGTSYTVVVGGGGSKKTASSSAQANSGYDSYFIDTSTVKGGGGAGGTYFANVIGNVAQGGTYVGDGGGNGGAGGGGSGTLSYALGGGGAGGYSGDGGYGGVYNVAGQDGAGGGGGGGGGGGSADLSGGGGGVGVYGQGINGAGGAGSTADAFPGLGGSGGADADTGTTGVPSNGGLYGGGGGASDGVLTEGGAGGHGAVRIIWGAQARFPYRADLSPYGESLN